MSGISSLKPDWDGERLRAGDWNSGMGPLACIRDFQRLQNAVDMGDPVVLETNAVVLLDIPSGAVAKGLLAKCRHKADAGNDHG